MHIIVEKSPLNNLTSQQIIEQNIEFGISVIGYDSTFSQTIHANGIYLPTDVIFDRYFEDVFLLDGVKIVSLDYRKFNDLKP